CLLLVSIGRPMNRIDGLIPRMRSAEQGPVYQILSKFSDIHRDEEIRQKFEIFRHVVFDFNGDYYIAVPLNAPEDEGSAAREEMLREAHLLANLFASFEKEKIFSRVVNPLLSTRIIQRKLKRQGSKFQESTGFRVYRFRSGAWSEIILGAVMGAAKRAETERKRHRLAEAIANAANRADAETRTIPDLGELPGAPELSPEIATSAPPAFESAAPAPAAPSHPRRAGIRHRPAPAAAAPATNIGHRAEPSSEQTDKFGPYAQSAADDFATEADIEIRSASATSPSDPAPAAKVVDLDRARKGSLKTLSRTRRTHSPVVVGDSADAAAEPATSPEMPAEPAAVIAMADETPPPLPVLTHEISVEELATLVDEDPNAAVQTPSDASIASTPAIEVITPELVGPVAEDDADDAVISRFAPVRRPRIEAAE
ncbi:MAG: hypothetical protein AAFU50_09870, partial [Pseudomonadota bacterium]